MDRHKQSQNRLEQLSRDKIWQNVLFISPPFYILAYAIPLKGMRRKKKNCFVPKQGKPTNFKDRYQAKSKVKKKTPKTNIIDPVLFINPSKRHYQKSARSKEEQTSPLKIDHYKRFVPE